MLLPKLESRSGALRLIGAAAIALAASCSSAIAPTQQYRRPLMPMLVGNAPFSQQELAGRLLAAHNRERTAAGVPPLRWDPALAASAASYGPALAAIGRLQHSPRSNRPGQAENLWMGSRSAYTPEHMVGTWIDERRDFRPGLFPAVSRTGNWSDVGHYTQMIWPSTTTIGCAVHRSPRWDFLICRYTPKGNVDGNRVG